MEVLVSCLLVLVNVFCILWVNSGEFFYRIFRICNFSFVGYLDIGFGIVNYFVKWFIKLFI